MLKNVDTSITDWGIRFIEQSNDDDHLLLPSSTPPKEIAKCAISLANDKGGYILLGAYSNPTLGSGYQNVDSEIVERCKPLLKGVQIEYSLHNLRMQNVYLLKIHQML